LEGRTERLFAFTKGFSQESLHIRSAPGYWNALEAINHIFLAEKFSVQYVKYKLTKPETIPRERPDAWFRMLLVKWVLYSPLKFKAPAPINMQNAQPILGISELQEEWGALRKELIEFLEAHEEQWKGKLVYKHPYAGRLTLAQMLIFFEDHLEHHARQIRHILRAVAK
jgi:uncharacterized damage-inducible protein DinB